MAVVAEASDAFGQKDINCSIDEGLGKFKAVTQKAKEHNIAVRGYISCVSGCPDQGDVEHTKVSAVAQSLLEMGCYEISLGDTIGVAKPDSIEALLTEILKTIEPEKLAVHLHDTHGQGIANITQSLTMGTRINNSPIDGLGGCPYAQGTSGNLHPHHRIQLLT